MSDIEDEPPSVLLPCTICSRTFKPEVLERHVKVCEKTTSKKRRVFDSFKNRVSGTELEEFLGPAPLPGQVPKRQAKSPVKKKNPSKWKETHENLIAVLRAARGVQPPPETLVDSTKHGVNEQCPSCSRFFGPRAFDRHVEFCKEKTARIKVTPSKVSQAQERLEARTKYRAPLSVKPKLTTKEKYSPMLPRKESTETCFVSSTSAKTSPPIPTLSKHAKNVTSNSAKSVASRSFERHRSVSPKKNIVSSSKLTNKNEYSTNKSSNHHPKIKDNLKEPDALRPKTGTKNTAQEKIRSCNVKLSQSEDETPSELSKSKQRGLDAPSEDESIGTIESDPREFHTKTFGKSNKKWSSSECIGKTAPQRAIAKTKTDKYSDEEKIPFKTTKGIPSSRDKKTEDAIPKSARMPTKQQKHQINDLSVNDQTFGIYVAPCARPPCPSTPSRISPRYSAKRENLNKTDESHHYLYQPEKTPNKPAKQKSVEKDALPPRETKTKKPDRTTNSKIPKPKQEGQILKVSREKQAQICETPAETTPKTPPETEPEKHDGDAFGTNAATNDLPITNPPQEDCLPTSETDYDQTKLNATAQKWANISEMSTEDLCRMTEDFDLADGEDSGQLSESAIWEIAAQQFLESEEPVQTTSVMSVDSLNENPPKITDKNGGNFGSWSSQRPVDNQIQGKGYNLESFPAFPESCPVLFPNVSFPDDFIVLHVTDPAKMEEIDAGMKLSISEPCFPCTGSGGHGAKGGQIPNILIFASFPGKVQKGRRRRKSRTRPKKVFPALKLSLAMREKTFLANDTPRAKRRRLVGDVEAEIRSNIETFTKTCFGGFSKDECEQKKTKFIHDLTNRDDKLYRWHVAKGFHFRFIDHIRTCLEEDLKELKYLALGNKKPQKSYAKKFKNEKYRQMKEKTLSAQSKSSPRVSKLTPNKKFCYFEIDLGNDIPLQDENETEIHQKTESHHLEEVSCLNKFEKPNDIVFQWEESSTANWPSEEPGAQNKTHSDLVDPSENTPNQIEENLSDRNRTSTPENTLSDANQFKIYPITELGPGIDDSAVGKRKSEHVQQKLSHLPDNKALYRVKSRETTATDSLQLFSNQNSSLENIEEVDEDEDKVPEEDIKIEDFILLKPDAKKLLSKEDLCLEGLFPRARKIADTVKADPSATVVRLDYTTNSVYDLKYNGEKTLNDFGHLPTPKTRRMLQKRFKNESSRLPQITPVTNDEKKENSMLSLIDLWKNKRGTPPGQREPDHSSYGIKLKLMPVGKLAPLSAKNSFQIKSDANDSYDPFKQAERQMLALLSWPSTTDIKTSKDFSPKSHPKENASSNLETSPTSAFTKYPETNDKSRKSLKSPGGARKELSETFVNQDLTQTSNKRNNRLEQPTYAAADDWEHIFEKHFDMNRNEMTEKMTTSVKSALDDLLKNTVHNSYGGSTKTRPDRERVRTPLKNRNNLSDNSIIEQILYTSTPKQTSKSTQREKSSNSSLKSCDRSPNFTRGSISSPADFDDTFGQVDDKKNRNSGLSLSGLSFSSQVSDTTLADEEVMRSNLEIVGKAAAAAAVSRTPRRKYARSQSVFEERNRMLFAKTYDPNASTSDEENIAESSLPKISEKPAPNKSPSRNSYPKPAPSHFYRSHSLFDSRCRGDGDHTDDGDHTSSPETNRNRKAKLSGDSAYSSLNRRSPRPNPPKNNIQEDRLSSGESDTSLPIVSQDYDQKKARKLAADFDNTGKRDKPVKMSKFCHECGSKYPVAVAKFCCECGVRRLVI